MSGQQIPESHHGRCLCGRISFVARGAPLWVLHCHCRSCRLNTGAPVATFVGYRPDRVDFAATPSLYESSPGVRRRFCANCGTPVSYEADRYADEIHLYIGAFDHPGAFPAQGHVHEDERIPWFDIVGDLPRKPGTTA